MERAAEVPPLGRVHWWFCAVHHDDHGMMPAAGHAQDKDSTTPRRSTEDGGQRGPFGRCVQYLARGWSSKAKCLFGRGRQWPPRVEEGMDSKAACHWARESVGRRDHTHEQCRSVSCSLRRDTQGPSGGTQSWHQHKSSVKADHDHGPLVRPECMSAAAWKRRKKKNGGRSLAVSCGWGVRWCWRLAAAGTRWPVWPTDALVILVWAWVLKRMWSGGDDLAQCRCTSRLRGAASASLQPYTSRPMYMHIQYIQYFV